MSLTRVAKQEAKLAIASILSSTAYKEFPTPCRDLNESSVVWTPEGNTKSFTLFPGL